jgi:hypothetical protein
MMKRIEKILLITSFIVSAFGYSASFGQTTNYQVYSLYVINMAKYSQWPVNNAEFHITVIGKSKVFDELSKQAATKNINGLPLKVTQTESAVDFDKVNIIYLSDGKSSMLDEILKAIHGKPIMVIAEREGLVKKGAGFSFVLMDNNTLRFDMNNSELEKRQIKVSKSLSSLANSTL